MNLSEDALHTWQGEAGVVGHDDPPQQLVTKDLQNHADIWKAAEELVSHLRVFEGPHKVGKDHKRPKQCKDKVIF